MITIPLLVVKGLEVVSGIATTAGIALLALGDWSRLLTSVPLILACLGTTAYYGRGRLTIQRRRGERGRKRRLRV